MDLNSGNIYDLDIDKARKLAQSETAMQLMAMLRANGSDQLQSALQLAASGNTAKAQQILSQLMENDRAKALLQQLQGEYNG